MALPGDKMTTRRALALAVMALTDEIQTAPDVQDWKQAKRIVRGLLEKERAKDDSAHTEPGGCIILGH